MNEHLFELDIFVDVRWLKNFVVDQILMWGIFCLV